MKTLFECAVGCSEEGTINGQRAPLFALRSLRDKQVDILRDFLSDRWDSEWLEIDEALTMLVEQRDRRCLSMLSACANQDPMGTAHLQFDRCKKLCELVARRERAEVESLTSRGVA
jgi:hypothetical protein